MKRSEKLFAGRKIAAAAGILWLAAVSGTGIAVAAGTERGAAAATGAETKSGAATASGAETKGGAAAASGAETERIAAAASGAETKSEAAAATGAEMERIAAAASGAETKSETAAATGAEAKGGAAAASGAEAESGTAVDARRAEELALLDAGIAAEDADRLRTKEEREGGAYVYEVSFTVDGTEYEYLIREADGKILEWEIDGRRINDAAAEESLEKQEDGSTVIGLEQAKQTALLDAGLAEDEVSFSTLKFEEEKRRSVYEIEFYQERWEYEYTIDAYTGEIVEADKDRD